jgi:hypothetical protein
VSAFGSHGPPVEVEVDELLEVDVPVLEEEDAVEEVAVLEVEELEDDAAPPEPLKSMLLTQAPITEANRVSPNKASRRRIGASCLSFQHGY